VEIFRKSKNKFPDISCVAFWFSCGEFVGFYV